MWGYTCHGEYFGGLLSSSSTAMIIQQRRMYRCSGIKYIFPSMVENGHRVMSVKRAIFNDCGAGLCNVAV